MTHRFVLLAALTGCIGIQTNPGHQDKPDAAVDKPDAPPVLIDGPEMLAAHHYIIDRQTVPTSNATARDLGLDLNGDATVDNQLGMVTGVMAQQGFNVQGDVTFAVDRGASLMLIDLEANDFASSNARFTLYTGANPQPPACNNGSDAICRHHLDGNGSFIVSVASARDPLLEGKFVGGTLTTTAGNANRLHLQTSQGVPEPMTLELLAARVKVTSVSTTSIASGVIAGGIAQSEIDGKLLPNWATRMNFVIAQDCPGAPPTCGCNTGSDGKTFVALFDSIVHNCSISVTELQENSLIKALLAPDLTIDGKPALSFGIGFTAVRATFTP